MTNIDNDHLDHYGSLEAIDEAFVNFVGQLPFYGLVALCAEDPGVRRNLSRFTKPFVTYGFSGDWDYVATEVREEAFGSKFRVRHCRNGVLGEISLHVPGRHNVLNALAVVAVCLDLGMPFAQVADGLAQYRGVKRRFEVRWRDEATSRAIVDDYGHHPTEIEATLAAARQFWKKRIIVVFQPHRYSRTLHCRDGFLHAFRGADVVLLTDIYAAGESPIDGVDSASLAEAMRRVAPQGQRIEAVGGLDAARDEVVKLMAPGDLILCMGAGTITRLPDSLMDAITGK